MARQNIILGVTGGIAAYKAPELVRRLTERGADVQVVMTRSAREFVTATSLQAVSGRAVRDSLWDDEAEAAMGHIELARWADLVLIAPATAEFLSRLAAGGAGDLLTTLCLATRAPICVAPAMNHLMWLNVATQENRKLLEERGVRFLGPEEGDMACGEYGPGRMVDPINIAASVTGPRVVAVDGPPVLQGKTVMVTAGPTREAIDPVRFISNRSSGKMGYAIAEAAARAGARVILVSGPVSLKVPESAQVVEVETAEQMFAATHRHIDGVDIFIGAAAVSDYKPVEVQANKIKKSAAEMSIGLVRAPDTLASVAALENGPFTVGFAAETERVKDYALSKLSKKRLDMIVANKVGGGRGFDQEENAVDVYWRDGEQSFPMCAKSDLAEALIRLIARRFDAAGGPDAGRKISAVASRD